MGALSFPRTIKIFRGKFVESTFDSDKNMDFGFFIFGGAVESTDQSRNFPAEILLEIFVLV